jgi:hypothetical protein
MLNYQQHIVPMTLCAKPLHSSGCCRESEREGRADADFTRHCDVASHSARKLATDRESEANAGVGTVECAPELSERTEHRLESFWWYAGPSVANVNCDLISMSLTLDGHFAAGRCRLE